MRNSQCPSGLRSDGVACEGMVAIAGWLGLSALPSSSAMGTPSALAKRQTTATVGLAWLRSICDNIDFETPAWRDSSSSDRARSWRKAARVSPTRGGSGATGRFIVGGDNLETGA